MKIALHGKAKSGKGTAALFLKQKLLNDNKEVVLTAFASYIKEMVIDMLPSSYKDEARRCLFGPSELRETKVLGSNLSFRDLLLAIGKLGRSIDEDFWINKTFDLVRLNENVIIEDLRFRNEFNSCKKNGYKIIKIKRLNHTHIDDISENDLNLFEDSMFDFVIDNNNDICSFQDDLNKLYQDLKV